MRSVFTPETNEQRTIQKVVNLLKNQVTNSMVNGNALTWTLTISGWKGDVTKIVATVDESASTDTGSTSAVSVTSGNAGDTYTSAEKTLINELKTDLNQLVTDFNALVAAHNNLLADHNELVESYNTLLARMRTAGHLSS